MGNDVDMISLEAMKSIFELVAVNLQNARARKDPEQFPEVTKLNVGNTMMVINHTAKPFEPKYIGNYRIVKLVGHRTQIQPCQAGPMKEEHLDHIKHVLPADQVYKWLFLIMKNLVEKLI